MAITNFRMNHQIQSEIIDIIKNAKDYCFIVSPYYRPWLQLNKALELSAKDDKRIFFFFRDDQQDNRAIYDLNDSFGFDVFFIKNLHAKLYLNEREALIASMNLFDYSKENNFEIAYKLTSPADSKELVTKVILGEMLKIWATGELRGRHYMDLENGFSDTKSFFKRPAQQSGSAPKREIGHCIRCGTGIPFNPNKPFCTDDFMVWNVYQNFEYEESYCHDCGKPSQTSMGKPLCYECFCKRVSAGF